VITLDGQALEGVEVFSFTAKFEDMGRRKRVRIAWSTAPPPVPNKVY